MSNILSFGKLLRRCAEVVQGEPLLVRDLHNQGLPMFKLYPHKSAADWTVRLQVFSKNMNFSLMRSYNSPNCQIAGTILDGKLYSGYSDSIKPSTYDKTWFEHFWPYYMPDGVKQQKRTTAVVRHLNGWHQENWHWTGGRRNRSGDLNRPSRQDWSQLWTCDSDNGSVVHNHLEFLHAANKVRMESAVGWFPYAVTEDEFYESFRSIESMDTSAMLALAGRAVAAAKHIAQTCKGWKVRVFPADRTGPWDRENEPPFHGCESHSISVRVEGGHRRMQLPLVLAYHPPSERYVCMHIPPVGNKYLDFQNPNVRVRSPLITPRNSHDRRTYTGLLAHDLSKGAPSASLHTYGPSLEDSHPLIIEEEKKLFNFGRSNDHVICRGYQCDRPMTQAYLEDPVAMTPEDVAALMEANELIESLPLC